MMMMPNGTQNINTSRGAYGGGEEGWDMTQLCV